MDNLAPAELLLQVILIFSTLFRKVPHLSLRDFLPTEQSLLLKLI